MQKIKVWRTEKTVIQRDNNRWIVTSANEPTVVVAPWKESTVALVLKGIINKKLI